MYFSAMYRLPGMLNLLGVPPLGVSNQNTVGKNGDFQPLRTKISRKP